MQLFSFFSPSSLSAAADLVEELISATLLLNPFSILFPTHSIVFCFYCQIWLKSLFCFLQGAGTSCHKTGQTNVRSFYCLPCCHCPIEQVARFFLFNILLFRHLLMFTCVTVSIVICTACWAANDLKGKTKMPWMWTLGMLRVNATWNLVNNVKSPE